MVIIGIPYWFFLKYNCEVLSGHVHTNPFSFEDGDLVSKTHRKFSVHTTTGKRRFRMYPLWRAFSKSSVFAVRTTTGKRRFPMYPLWRAFSKSSVFAVHTTTGKRRFPMYPLWRAFSKSSVFGDRRRRISVDERSNRIKSIRFQTKTD